MAWYQPPMVVVCAASAADVGAPIAKPDAKILSAKPPSPIAACLAHHVICPVSCTPPTSDLANCKLYDVPVLIVHSPLQTVIRSPPTDGPNHKLLHAVLTFLPGSAVPDNSALCPWPTHLEVEDAVRVR